MKKTTTAAIALSIGLALAGCSTTAPAPEAPSVAPAGGASTQATTTPAAVATTGPAKSSRGNLVKGVGVGAGITNAEGEVTATFVVTAIEVDPVCTGAYTQPSENGHIVVLTVEAATTPELAKSTNPTFALAGMSWKAIAENGTTQNQDTSTYAAFSCLDDADQFPSGMGPDEKATGKIAFDVVSPAGILVYSPTPTLGWEWAYPAK